MKIIIKKISALKLKTNKKNSTKKDNKIYTTAGIVVNVPGNFSSRYFYLLPEYGEPLLQIYNNKKLFPLLKIGDQIIVSGEYSESETGSKLKTKLANDISIIGHEKFSQPKLSSSADLKLPPYPRLVLVEGEIISKKSPRLYLADDQGEVEIYFTKGSNLKTSNFNVGEKISVLGILTNDNSLRLQPRNKDDIQLITIPEITKASLENKTKNQATEKINNLNPNPKKKNLLGYLIGGGLTTISSLLYFLLKNK